MSGWIQATMQQNTITAQLFCASLYRCVLSPFKFAVQQSQICKRNYDIYIFTAGSLEKDTSLVQLEKFRVFLFSDGFKGSQHDGVKATLKKRYTQNSSKIHF